jgi:hypothetical protein
MKVMFSKPCISVWLRRMDCIQSLVNELRIYFERKISKNFYGAVYDEQWSCRYCHELYVCARNLQSLHLKFMRINTLTLSWPAGHIFPTYKESFQVRWGNSVPLFLHAAIYLEVYLFLWTSQNAFSRETAMYKWYCVQCCFAALHTVSFVTSVSGKYMSRWSRRG